MRFGVAVVVTTSFILSSLAQAQVERPPQFVLLAYDGSYNNKVWQESREFSLDEKSQGIDTHFTYFINPAYLLWKCPASAVNCKAPPYQRSTYYQPPGSTNGVKNLGSAIGWGDSDADISTRLDHMNGAYEEGHEIGSHAVGHWDGSSWSYADWVSEFRQFYSILDGVFGINKLKSSAKYGYNLLFRNSITGFRAPLLGFSKGMYQALPEFGIQYDTSQQTVPNYWPARNSFGTWNFPLAAIKRPGSAKTLPSMDYNFCVSDSAALLQTDPTLATYQAPGFKKNANRECLFSVRPEQKAALKKSMYDSYMNYFNSNYYGNRAPVNIGHHFSNWMSGAYYETFYEFAREVCAKPEVKCVTYQELQAFLEQAGSNKIKQYAATAFQKLARPKSSIADRTFDVNLKLAQKGDVFVAQVTGKDKALFQSRIAIYVGNEKLNAKQVRVQDIQKTVKAGENTTLRAVVLNSKNQEIQSATHKLENFGTDKQIFSKISIEEVAASGHLKQAHEFEQDIDENNMEHFGH